MNDISIKRALLTCADKSSLESLAKTLVSFGCELISTGGTKHFLQEKGFVVTDISKLTRNPEAFQGRVKTLSFHSSAAVLFDRQRDAFEAQRLEVQPIDLVVCNFYPFKQVSAQENDLSTLVESIDIGGPTAIRSAAKNFRYVAALSRSCDYPEVIEELQQKQGKLSYETRKKLMGIAFQVTSNYEAAIADKMDELNEKKSLRLHFSQPKELRYGENSHQQACYFKQDAHQNSLFDLKCIHGKELSYNNINDINAAIDSIQGLEQQACCIIKHKTPCGLAQSLEQKQAFIRAWQGDQISAFGSVVAFNQEVQEQTARCFDFHKANPSEHKFIEIIIAPSFSSQALEILKQKKHLRIVIADPKDYKEDFEIKYFKGSLLYQQSNQELCSQQKWVTKNQSNHASKSLIDFGLHAIKAIPSNAIVIARQNTDGSLQMIGMGAGQPNRKVAVRLAIDKAKENIAKEQQMDESKLLANTVLLSEAFFPFADSIELCAKAGVTCVIQPGGSRRDFEVIESCNKHNIAMMFTGTRHFKH